MKILLVSGSFFPDSSPRSFRTTELTKELCRQGHKVTIFIPKTDFDYSAFCNEYPVDIRQYDRVCEKNCFTHISLIDKITVRLLNQFFAYPANLNLPILQKAVCNEKGYDLLITIAVPHFIHWAFGRLYEKGNKAATTWIADCGDPFMLSDSGKYRPPFYFKPLETRWCRMCDYISVPTKTSYLGYYPEFRNKIKVIPQGFRFEDVVLDNYKSHDIPTFAFSGGLMAGRRDIRPIIDKLLKLGKPFKLFVFTKDNEFFDSYKSLIGTSIILSGFIPRLELLKILSTMDFLLNIENGTMVQTPSKLIDYGLTGRPILSIDNNNIDENKLLDFLNGNYTKQLVIENIDQYNIKSVVKHFLELC